MSGENNVRSQVMVGSDVLTYFFLSAITKDVANCRDRSVVRLPMAGGMAFGRSMLARLQRIRRTFTERG